MKQKEVFKKIGTIVKELNEQYDYLKTTGEQLNDLELELFVANAHFLADHAQILRKLNLQNTSEPALKPEVTKEERYFEPVVQQAKPVAEPKLEIEELPVLPKDNPARPMNEEEAHEEYTEYTPVPHIDLQGNGADDDFSVMRREEPEVIKHELVLDETQNWDEEDEGFLSDEVINAVVEEEEIKETPVEEVAEPEPAKPIVEPEPVKRVAPPELEKPIEIPVAVEKPAVVETKKAEPKIEEPAEEPLTINQRLSAQMGKQDARIAEQHHTQTITDLKQAINLNDKLLYIKDLFNGYNLAYSEAIDILNRFTTFEEAENFLQSSYATKNNWESNQGTVDKFYALLRRRYL